MAAGQRLLLRSVDDYLGPAESRFFSRGYQRAEYAVHGITVLPAQTGELCVTASADLSYPADWSKKKDGVDLRPHLSTVDALVLGVQLAEVHLARARRLDAVQRRTTRLRKIVLRAGNEPQEELTGVPLSATWLRSEPLAADAGRALSVYDCTVGGLRVRCELEHPAPAGDTETQAVFGSLAEALGEGELRFYGEGFKFRRHTVEEVRVDTPALSAEAEVRFTAVPGSPAATEGVEGEHSDCPSLIDCFVVNLQLAQILMYELDGLSRANSNTLWMMQTVLEAPEHPVPLPVAGQHALRAATELSGKRLLPLRGSTWRSVDLRGEMAGIGMRAAFAHELPARDTPYLP
ncbi:AvrD family protein [Streptomyces chiangmaiensis]|uniref:AvrD family protein n=1 Tax=Streptomyces chiangmaiensis TaxID=766497 RepID=A0ABU7FJR3_9ACTN|nr:AvrD family protein [Streptomyces chiangmaiensis]MED7824221.1 AvrD family protein [Streptomyces chiangmaiensis]